MTSGRVYRRPCPGRDGKPCGRHLRADSRDGLCFRCRVGGFSAPPPVRPRPTGAAEVLPLDVSRETADAMLSRAWPLVRRELLVVIGPEVLEQLVLSVYGQGFKDGHQVAGMEAARRARSA